MNIFNLVKTTKPPFSTFDLSHDVKLSMKMGDLVPVNNIEVLPGDRIRISSEAMLRMMPQIAPIMHKVDVTFHHFFVPNRITWPNWETFITGAKNGKTVPQPALPTISFKEVKVGSLANYLGLPVLPLDNLHPFTVSALPFAAYERLWYDWYRDQNLQELDQIELIDGDNGLQGNDILLRLLTMRKRAWEHDYFTSCLPWTQKGDPVTLPIGFEDADIVATDQGAPGFNPLMRFASNGAPATGGGSENILINNFGSTFSPRNSNAGIYYDPQGTLSIEGQASTTIEDLRRANVLQQYLEKNARSGNRFFEWLRAHFGVNSPDSRLQRAEYLGGSKASMAISEVLQTSSTDNTSPQGGMAGHGISLTMGQDVNYRVPEHGYIITIINCQPKTAYMNGLPKMFTKFDKFDYAIPAFSTLGEQPVYQRELNLTRDTDIDNKVFGYLPIYSDYRFQNSRVAGQMATSLDYWHMARKFDNSTEVPLNDEFITADPTTRIFAVEDEENDTIVAHIYNKIMASRPLPKYGVPRLA